jgi:predicted Zn-dependent protease
MHPIAMMVALTTAFSSRGAAVRKPAASTVGPWIARGAVGRSLAWLGVLLILFPLACSTNPQTGGREVMVISEEDEVEIDRQESRAVEDQIGLVDNPALQEYVERLGDQLAQNALRKDVDYVFSVVEMDEPNAFALPGGHIYVSRGLLVLANSEPELANVLGHEIGHVTARHASQRATAGVAYTVGSLLLAVAAAVAGSPEAAAGIGSFLTMGGPQQALAAYSREQESEADRLGQTLAAESGVDPSGMAEFLDALDDYTRLRLGASRQISWFDTHPATPDRIAETSARAQGMSWKPTFSIAPVRRSFLDRIEGMSVSRPASEGIVRDGWLLHPDLRLAVRFPPGWEVLNEHARVIGISGDREAYVMLELQGPGDDPRAAAAADAQRLDLVFSDARPVLVGPLQAFRARTSLDGPDGRARAEVTWIAYQGRIYRLSGMTSGTGFGKYEGSFRSFFRSFRAIEPDELASIEEVRLRLATAREGETLLEFNARVGNEWNVNTTAVMNRINPGRALVEGQVLKIARREPYQPGLPASPDAEVAGSAAESTAEPAAD